MLVLGIESSCDETAAAVVTGAGVVLSDVIHSQIETHRVHGGVVPELASRDHLRNVRFVVEGALTRANVALSEIDAIAVTHRPGLVGALLVGVSIAKGIAWASGKPLVGVDHLVGHLFAVFLRRAEEDHRAPEFPFVALLVSGGHTAIYRVDGPRAADVSELGATRDDAAGEAFDKVAKMLGLGYPGGPVVDKLAASGDASRFSFTTPMAQKSSLEFSFSGIKTQVAHHIAKHGAPASDQEMRDLCASFQRTVVDTLAKKTIRAAQRENISTIVLGGGVAANRELRARITELSQKQAIDVFLPSIANCTDNAAMIAYAGLLRLRLGERDGFDLMAMSRTSLPRVSRKGRGSR